MPQRKPRTGPRVYVRVGDMIRGGIVVGKKPDHHRPGTYYYMVYVKDWADTRDFEAVDVAERSMAGRNYLKQVSRLANLRHLLCVAQAHARQLEQFYKSEPKVERRNGFNVPTVKCRRKR